VRVQHDEGVASHIGPEPCVGSREGAGEASVGECIGQTLSRERVLFPGADAVNWAEGNMGGRDSASAPSARRGRRPWHVQTLFAREPGGLAPDQQQRAVVSVRIGKARSRNR
jgi:hypothetical protein